MSKYVATILIAVFAVSVASVDALKWCVTSTEEKTSCEKITNSAEMLAQIAVTCTVQTDCATSMQSGTVDIWSNVDGATLYDLNRAIGVSVVAGEAYSFTQAVNYYSTAVVKASDCASGRITKLADLKGKRSCHTGYGKSAGWKIPITKLLANDIMELKVSDDSNYPNDMASAAAFFDSTCAPMKTDAMALKNANTLCKNCGNGAGKAGHCCRGDTESCQGSDKYYGYDGAFRCLAEGNGDVAFVKHITVPRNTEGGDNFANTGDWAWPNEAAKKSTAYKLICPGNFKCYDPADYLQCYLSAVPSHSVVMHPSVSQTDGNRFATGLNNYQGTTAAKTAFFNSGSNADGHMFKKGTTSLVMNSLSTDDYLKDAAEVYRNLNTMNLATIGTYNTTTTILKTESKDDDALLGAVIAIAVVVAGLLGFTTYMAMREKQGKPVFAKLDV